MKELYLHSELQEFEEARLHIPTEYASNALQMIANTIKDITAVDIDSTFVNDILVNRGKRNIKNYTIYIECSDGYFIITIDRIDDVLVWRSIEELAEFYYGEDWYNHAQLDVEAYAGTGESFKDMTRSEKNGFIDFVSKHRKIDPYLCKKLFEMIF
jgi:hypothetical protein